MQYFTVKEISDKVGRDNIHSVIQMNKKVAIQLVGSIIDRVCTMPECAKSLHNPQETHHIGAGVRPRIVISSF